MIRVQNKYLLITIFLFLLHFKFHVFSDRIRHGFEHIFSYQNPFRGQRKFQIQFTNMKRTPLALNVCRGDGSSSTAIGAQNKNILKISVRTHTHILVQTFNRGLFFLQEFYSQPLTT